MSGVDDKSGAGNTADQRLDWDDLGYSAVPEPHEYHVCWRIVEQIGMVSRDGGPSERAWSAWNAEDPGFHITFDAAAADPVVEVSVKWDGCANYSWPEHVCTHTCGREGVQNLGEALLRVFDASAALIPKADAEMFT